MVRINVPDDFDAGHIAISGARDRQDGSADLTTDSVDHARDVSVREDDDGQRYVGVSKHYADDVREYLGVADDEAGDSDANPEGSSGETPDADGEYPPAEKTVGAHWNQIVAAVNDGVYDDTLDTVAENDDRDSVQNAIEDRRTALEDADG